MLGLLVSCNTNCKVHGLLQTACGRDNFTNPQPSDLYVQTADMPDLNNLQSLLEGGGVN